MARETELFRAKEENFQELLDYRKSIKGTLGGGCTTIRCDWETGEWVLVHRRETWAASIIDSTVKMGTVLESLGEYPTEESA